MCLDNPPVHCSIVVVAASFHRNVPGSLPRGVKCIFLVATKLAYESNAAERPSPESLRTFPGMFGDIPQNIWGDSPECLATFPRIFYDIPQNVWRHSPEYNIPPIPRVLRILFPVPVFLFLYIANRANIPTE